MGCRVVVIGCGGMGRQHLRVLRELPGFEAVGVCDLIAESAEKVGDEFDVGSRETDAERLYDSLSPDLVTVATETRGHHALTIAALERGIPVLCEKPIAIDLGEADEMVTAAEKTGAKLAINQQHHVGPAILKALELQNKGVIGDTVMVRGRNKCGRKSGNEFMEMGTHVTNMMIRFGGVPMWCSGTVSVDGRLGEPKDIMEAKEMSPRDRDSGLVMGDRAVGSYGFESGASGEVHFLGFQERYNKNYGVDILGARGALAVRSNRVWHLPRPMEGHPGGDGDWDLVYSGPEEEGDQGPVATMYKMLLKSIREDSEPPSSGGTGRLALEMIMGIYESHRQGGKRVEIPLEERGHPLKKWKSDGEPVGRCWDGERSI